MSPIPPSQYIAYRKMVEATKGVGGSDGALSQRAHGKKGKPSAFGKVLDDLDDNKKDEKETDSKGSTRLAMMGGASSPSTTSAAGTQGAQENPVEEKKKKVLKSEVVIVGSEQSTSLQNLNFKKTDDE